MSAVPRPIAAKLDVLDACHQQIIECLTRLTALAVHVEAQGINLFAQQQATAIEAFFSSTLRQHHRDEEKLVFAPLRASDDAELASLLRMLQQDHGWIEEDWLELAPQLRAIALGNHWIDNAEFQHNVEVFRDLNLGHIELEEKVIYPKARTLAAVAGARRAPRVPQ